MSVQQYLCVIVCLIVLGVYTVTNHVERVRIGYDMRRIKKEIRRLKQERKSRHLMWERLAAAENVAQQALHHEVISRQEVESLAVTNQEQPGTH